MGIAPISTPLLIEFTRGKAANLKTPTVIELPAGPITLPIGETATKPSLLSKFKTTANGVKTWGKAPISESPVYQGVSNGTSKILAKLAEKAS